MLPLLSTSRICCITALSAWEEAGNCLSRMNCPAWFLQQILSAWSPPRRHGHSTSCALIQLMYRQGRYNLDPNIRFLCLPPVHGALRKYVDHPAEHCFKLPDCLTYEQGALVEPLSVAGQTMLSGFCHVPKQLHSPLLNGDLGSNALTDGYTQAIQWLTEVCMLTCSVCHNWHLEAASGGGEEREKSVFPGPCPQSDANTNCTFSNKRFVACSACVQKSWSWTWQESGSHWGRAHR